VGGDLSSMRAAPQRVTTASVSPLIRPTRGATAEEALTALYERHGKRVLRFCRHWLRSREEAEDAVQTTFLNAFRGLERGVVPAHEEAWLLAIARNACLARTDAALRRAVEVTRDPHSLDELVATPVEADELEGLGEAFAALTQQQRRAVFLREWHGLSYREIAETLSLSQAAVETLLFRARRTLARHVRRPLGIGSFAPWLRSLLEGAAGKVAFGAAAVAVTATTGTMAIVPGHQHADTLQVMRSAPVARSSAPVAQRAPQAKVGSPRRRIVAPQPTPAPVALQTTRGLAPAVPPAATTPPAASTGPAAAAAPPSAPAAPPPTPATETTTPLAPTLPNPVQTTGADATGAVGTVAAGAADTVGQATENVAATAANVTATVQQTTQAVANVVTTLVDPHRLFP
jgi:RNA polymerase sigma-70 factor, ECF subfamily